MGSHVPTLGCKCRYSYMDPLGQLGQSTRILGKPVYMRRLIQKMLHTLQEFDGTISMIFLEASAIPFLDSSVFATLNPKPKP